MRKVLLKNGFSLPVLGMGTWLFGGRETRDPSNDDAGQIAALQAGIEAGFSLIDTAEYYAGGYAETLTGRAIAGYPRAGLFLTSKVWKTHLRRDDVLRAAENSLRRLGTDYLDLYLYHQVSEQVPLEETIGAMNELVERKLVRHIGVSNFAPAGTRHAGVQCADRAESGALQFEIPGTGIIRAAGFLPGTRCAGPGMASGARRGNVSSDGGTVPQV